MLFSLYVNPGDLQLHKYSPYTESIRRIYYLFPSVCHIYNICSRPVSVSLCYKFECKELSNTLMVSV